MISQKESKQVKMDSWLLKLPSRDKNKSKKQIKQQTIIKMGDGRYRSLI